MQTYEEFVNSRFKDGLVILKKLSPEKCEMLHATFGLGTEVGELQDAFKKHVFYDKPLDIVNVEEELGDIEFYLQALYTTLQHEGYTVDRHSAIAANRAKLEKRYPQGYTDKDAQARADKQSDYSERDE